jgi:hypothetical protein
LEIHSALEKTLKTAASATVAPCGAVLPCGLVYNLELGDRRVLSAVPWCYTYFCRFLLSFIELYISAWCMVICTGDMAIRVRITEQPGSVEPYR